MNIPSSRSDTPWSDPTMGPARKAVRLADPFLWKEALNRRQLYADFGLDDDPYSPYQDDD